jgi:hypothetical protein
LGTIKEALVGEYKRFLNHVDSDDLDEFGTKKKKDLVEESAAAARKPSASLPLRGRDVTRIPKRLSNLRRGNI